MASLVDVPTGSKELIVEHKALPTDEGSLAGAWWKDHASLPVCTWTYDRTTRSLSIQRGCWHRSHKTIPHLRAPVSDQELVDRLSHVALMTARGYTRKK
jgi:hypothetical protein